MWANNAILDEQDLLSSNKSTKSETASAKRIGFPDESEVSNENNEVLNKNQPNAKTIIQDRWSYPKENDDPNSRSSSIVFSVRRDSANAFDEHFLATEIAEHINAGNYSLASGIVKLMLEEPLCLLVVANATYGILIVLMQIIHKIVFGRLRPIERQHIKDKFWNFVFYKFIFIFGVMNVQSLNGVLVWVSWFTAIAFLLLLTKLSKDRFEFLSFSPNTPMYYHWKVVGLLVFILFCCIILAVSCVTHTFPFTSTSSANSDIHSMTFMLAECTIIAVKVVHVILKYSIHLYDVQHEELWERKATVVYHVDLVMELLSLLVNFAHHLHMLFSGNIWLSMASLVICMQLRFIFSEIQKRFLRHKNYRRVVANMEAQFPAATSEELEEHEDRCAICWDQMETARKLPCGHLFHAPCLRSWLEQDTTCPTCRKQLGIRQNNQRDGDDLPDDVNDVNGGNVPGMVPNPGGVMLNPTAGGPVGGGQQHFWHFDGSRFASWLPSFSVEVSHTVHGAQAMVTTTAGTNQRNQELANSQLDAMVREVQDIFPQIPARIIANDLRQTGSVEATTHNILEGNITVSTDQVIPPAQPPPAPANNQSLYQLPPFSIGGGLRRRNVAHTVVSNMARSQPTVVFPSNSTPSTSASAPARHVPAPEEEGDTNEDVEPSPTADTPVFSRFSKAPEEREKVLQSRRDMLIRKARLKYLQSKQIHEVPVAVATSSNTQLSESGSSASSRLSGRDGDIVAASSSQRNNLTDAPHPFYPQPPPEQTTSSSSSEGFLDNSFGNEAKDSDTDDEMINEPLD